MTSYDFYQVLYNNPSYSHILIGSRLWSIRGQMHDWCHHYKVFPSAVLKWWKVLRIRIIFYVTRLKISTKRSCRGFEQVWETRRRKIKPFFRKMIPKRFSSSLSRQSSDTKLGTKLVLIIHPSIHPYIHTYIPHIHTLYLISDLQSSWT